MSPSCNNWGLCGNNGKGSKNVFWKQTRNCFVIIVSCSPSILLTKYCRLEMDWWKHHWSNISNTSVSSDIQTLRKGLEKTRCSQVSFNQLWSVWISDETLFLMFDIASWSINNSERNSKKFILREIQSKCSLHFMIIGIKYPNLLPYELLMIWEVDVVCSSFH